MDSFKTKALEQIEMRMEKLDRKSMRYHLLESAKQFKSSWIKLGQALYTVWKDKLYREWGYMKFDAYTAKEVGIRKQTALKLLRSYSFLEREAPEFLRSDYADSTHAARIPSYESVNVLRLAKNRKELDRNDYVNMRREVLEEGRDAGAVKKDLTALIKEREEITPEEARKKKKIAVVKRFLGTLKSLKRDLELMKLLPSPVIKQAEQLIRTIENEMPGQPPTVIKKYQ